MNRNYQTPTVAQDWADSRETHMAVATAIHAISGSTRSPEEIWENPTDAEWDHVTMAVEEYVHHGDYDAEPDGRYPWGQETVTLSQTFEVGDRVEGGEGEDFDRGIIHEIKGDQAFVGWKTGVATWTPIEILRHSE